MESPVKKPRGRPPVGAILRDGRWELTEESLEKAAMRLIKHREDCRLRYRRKRDELKARRPELFMKRRQRALTDTSSANRNGRLPATVPGMQASE